MTGIWSFTIIAFCTVLLLTKVLHLIAALTQQSLSYFSASLEQNLVSVSPVEMGLRSKETPERCREKIQDVLKQVGYYLMFLFIILVIPSNILTKSLHLLKVCTLQSSESQVLLLKHVNITATEPHEPWHSWIFYVMFPFFPICMWNSAWKTTQISRINNRQEIIQIALCYMLNNI